MTTEDNIQVHLDEDWHRYVLTFDGDPVGVAHFLPHGDQVVFTHTVVDERFEGQGLGSTLVHEALDDVRDRGKRIVPVCPFVQAYLSRHHEWDDLIDPLNRRLKETMAD